MHMTPFQDVLGALSGILVGFSLGLVGGGGSIIAVPLIVYLVGVPDPHLAIGTSVLAVALNAGFNFLTHARVGTVKWPCALVFAATGALGAFLGSTAGKAIDGQKLLFLFALLMILVGFFMLRRRSSEGDPHVHLTAANAPKLIALGLFSGALAGFFGIGGGFLIVPSLILATGMPTINAVGSSLLSVAAFGASTAANYAAAGWVDWVLSVCFMGGGMVGGSLVSAWPAVWRVSGAGSMSSLPASSL